MKLSDFKFLSLNCKTASRLLSEAEDRQLSGLERAGLKLHVATCKSCRKFREQLAVMRQALKSLDEQIFFPVTEAAKLPSLSIEARQRIASKLADENKE